MCGIDEYISGKLHHFVVKAVVKETSEFCRRVRRREVRAPHVADEKSIACEHCPWFVGLFFVGYDDADALWRMSGGILYVDAHFPNAELKTVSHLHACKA